MTDLQIALQSNEMMDAYLELNNTTDIIKEIRDYAEIKAIENEHYKITGNEPAMPFEAATENELLSGHITGLTIRQEFAARAMQGLMTTLTPTSDNLIFPNDENVIYMANLAVFASHELIKALNK